MNRYTPEQTSTNSLKRLKVSYQINFFIIILATSIQSSALAITTDCVPATYSETTGALVIPSVDVTQSDGSFKVYTANLQRQAGAYVLGFAVSENNLTLKGEISTHDQCHAIFGEGKLYIPYVKLASKTDAVFEAVLALSAENPNLLDLLDAKERAKEIISGEELSSNPEGDVSVPSDVNSLEGRGTPRGRNPNVTRVPSRGTTVVPGERISAAATTKNDVSLPSTIKIYGAGYGQDLWIFFPFYKKELYCNATNAFKQQCDGKSSCKVRVDNKLCGDPFWSALKRGIVDFACSNGGKAPYEYQYSALENTVITINCPYGASWSIF